MYPSHYFSIHSRREESNRHRGLGFKTADGGRGEVLRNSSCPCEGCDCYPARPGQEQDGNRRRDGWEDGKWRLLIDSAVERWKKGFHTLLSGRSPINMRGAQCSRGQRYYLDQHNPYFKCLKFLSGVCESVLCGERAQCVTSAL